jgi:hypothetical protein
MFLLVSIAGETMNHSFNSHRIQGIWIIWEFLDGTKFELADGLNCFIGARGAGKTKMLEFVRYAMTALPGRKVYRAVNSLTLFRLQVT